MCAKKRVVFCTYSSIYSSKVLEQLIVDSDIELVTIINSKRLIKPSLNLILGSIYQLKTSGLRYSSYLFFISEFFKWIQPLLKVFHKWPLKTIHALAKLNQIPLLDTKDINSSDIIERIKKLEPDYLLCAHFNQLLKEPLLSIDGLECINIHPSLLPNYKGVDPVFYAMRDNVGEIGVSLHRMNANFDSGEVLLQTSFKLDRTKSLLFNNCQLFSEGSSLASKWIKNELQQDKSLFDIEQDKNNFENYDSWPDKGSIKQFKQSGKRLMNLSGLWKQQ